MALTITSKYLRSSGTAFLLLLTAGLTSALWCWRQGYTLFDFDAEMHLNIARRLLDPLTAAGLQESGTGWLPLSHVLIAPLAAVDSWWRSGLAGALPSALYFAIAGSFLFASARRLFDSMAAGWTAALIFAVNPNTLYLAAVPMTEMLFAAEVACLLWAVLWYRDSRSIKAVLLLGAVSSAASLTRYEGWLLIPFIALAVWIFARCPVHTLLFGALAALGPLAWLLYNQFTYGNALEFYNGPNSRMALHRGSHSPTFHNWRGSLGYYVEAARLVSGTTLFLAGAAGALVAAFFRTARPVLLLLIPPAFFILSLNGGGADLSVPTLWPYTMHNVRYGFPGFVFVASASSALVTLLYRRRWIAAAVLVGAALIPWFTIGPICWREARDNSKTRRTAQNQATATLEVKVPNWRL
jgi:4-amino-4-deoxy-L-arabinose transferase-like glycosyltransferase